jgi:anti-sigma-K factor RskA
MNLDHLQKKLIAAARVSQPSDRVPYAFEKRVMARIAETTSDWLGAWSVALWRAAISCIALVILSGALSLWSSHRQHDLDFSQDFETAVLASVSSVDDAP